MTGDAKRGRRQCRRNLKMKFVKVINQNKNVGKERKSGGLTKNQGPEIFFSNRRSFRFNNRTILKCSTKCSAYYFHNKPAPQPSLLFSFSSS